MVGDNYDADILGARQLEMNTIWITRRIHLPSGDPLLQGETVVSSLSEIPGLLSTPVKVFCLEILINNHLGL